MKGNKVPLPENAPVPGTEYRHYKGDHYRVTALALHSDDEVWMVEYEPLYEDADAPLFTKALSEWNKEVEWEGKRVARFVKVE